MANGMVHRVFRWIGYGALVAAIVAIVVWSGILNRKHQTTQPVKSLSINITGGGKYPLADVESIDRWIREHGLYKEGMTLEKLNIGDIEHMATSHNAVASANVFVGYRGDAIVDIELRTPIARLRTNGYDLYITEDGFVLPTVDDRTAAVPVITGGYKPLFRPDFTGYAAEMVRDSIASLERHIVALEDAKQPYYRQLDTADRELREVLNLSVRKGLFMSQDEFQVLVSDLQSRKVAARERHTAKRREIESAIATLTTEQQEARLKQRDVQNAGRDFDALIDFLKSVDNNNFWRAEIVQFMLAGGCKEHMEISFVPRSGSFVVDLGTATDLDKKLSNLYRFYHKGLDKMGWDKHTRISLRYDGQVVCR